MEGSLVNILTWQKPIKSALALVSLNLTFWSLTGQRPLCIIAICLLFVVLRAAWKRIRGVVLIDPPDHESWTTLETYHMKHNTIDFSKSVLTQYFLLRGKSHIVFSMLSCLIFLGIGKLGTYIYLRTLLFLLANAAFLMGPFMKLVHVIPKEETTDELVPDIVGGGDLWFPSDLPGGPDSLNAFVPPRIPDHDEDSGDDEFHFDTKHFDSSSTTSSTNSNSFELINL